MAKNLRKNDVIDGQWKFKGKRPRKMKIEQRNGKALIKRWTEYRLEELSTGLVYGFDSETAHEMFGSRREAEGVV